MDGQEYLNQISSEVRLEKNNKMSGLLHSKFFMVGVIGIVALIIVVILGAIINGGRTSTEEKVTALKLHLDNTAEVIKEYQNDVKSSSLRSDAASLYGVLTNTSRELEEYLAGESNAGATKKATTTAEENKETLEQELFEAKINGLLDRTMARKMSYEISTLINEETSITKTTKSETLNNTLTQLHSSLETLYENFNNFTEGK